MSIFYWILHKNDRFLTSAHKENVFLVHWFTILKLFLYLAWNKFYFLQVKISEKVEVYTKEDAPDDYNDYSKFPDVNQPREKLYGESLIPYNRPTSASFVNVNSFIRRPKVMQKENLNVLFITNV